MIIPGETGGTKVLKEKGIGLWLDNITREILDDDTHEKYISELSVNGLTTNPSISDNAIAGSDGYNRSIWTGWPGTFQTGSYQSSQKTAKATGL